MAEAFFNKYSRKNRAVSAGLGRYPRSAASPKGIRASIKVLDEVGVKMPYRLGRPVRKEDVQKAGMVVVLLDKEHRYLLPGYVVDSAKTRYYSIHDSDARLRSFLDQHRRNRDTVKRIVLGLVKKIG